MLHNLGGIGETLIGAVRTRLELVSNEIEEQGARIAQMALLWAAAGFCLALAVVLGAVLLVVLYWEENRIVVLALLTALFAAAGVALAAAAHSSARARPRALEATLAELKTDLEALRAAARESHS